MKAEEKLTINAVFQALRKRFGLANKNDVITRVKSQANGH